MPYPIQLGAVTDRMRNFFRLRGKTTFMLDEVVVPVTMIQDLTKGPYQAGVVPVAAEININNAAGTTGGLALILNNKPGSLISLAGLGQDMNGKSFSVTSVEIQNSIGDPATGQIFLFYCSRSQIEDILAVPVASSPLNKIQFGSISGGTVNQLVSAELFTFNDDTGITLGNGQRIWSGVLAASPGIGSLRTFEPEPAATIGPADAIYLQLPNVGAVNNVRVSVRGWFNEQIE